MTAFTDEELREYPPELRRGGSISPLQIRVIHKYKGWLFSLMTFLPQVCFSDEPPA